MAAAGESQNASRLTLAQTTRSLLVRRPGNRKVLALLAVAVVGAALALNWSWLLAAGIAPILLALAPCAAMCALGLCVGRMGGKSCAGGKDTGTASAWNSNPTEGGR